MSLSPPPRPGSRAAARSRLAARPPLALLAPARSAGAQEACAAGSLAHYLVEGFRCRLGRWTVSRLSYHTGVDARGGARAPPRVDAADDQVQPFPGTDAAGRATFGFDFSGLTTGVGAHGTDTGRERAHSIEQVGFFLDAGAPGLQLAGAEIAGAFEGGVPPVGRLRGGSTLSASVFQLAGGFRDCSLDLLARSTDPGPPVRAVRGDCREPLVRRVGVNLTVGSTLNGFGPGEGAVDGFTGAALTRAGSAETQAVVPEPATLTLVAGGLPALAGFGRRQRRASAWPIASRPPGA